MKKAAYLLLICICLTGCRQCKKNPNTVVSGVIVDEVTGNPIANAEVFLGIVESTSGGVNSTTEDKTTSDANGKYSFNFKATKGKDYAIVAKADRYFTTESVSEYQITEGKMNAGFLVYLKPIATIKIHVKKTDVSYDSLYTFFNLIEQGTSKFAVGKNVDTNLFYKYQKAGINKDIYIYIKI